MVLATECWKTQVDQLQRPNANFKNKLVPESMETSTNYAKFLKKKTNHMHQIIDRFHSLVA